jgi:putative ABC transport system substrate-binding protein
MVHSDDDNGIANVAAATGKGKPLGLEVSARQSARMSISRPS